tara:strand:- start:944 stop:1201 length:258 start_codon:yes stop_codon:yes gene_type:complete
MCDAKTKVIGQSSVYVNGKLWAVDGDPEEPDHHDLGQLIPTGQSVTINGKRVIVLTPDRAKIDGLGHVGMADATKTASSDTSAYG